MADGADAPATRDLARLLNAPPPRRPRADTGTVRPLSDAPPPGGSEGSRPETALDPLTPGPRLTSREEQVAKTPSAPAARPGPTTPAARATATQHVMTLCLSEEAYRLLEQAVVENGLLVREAVIGAVNTAYEALRSRAAARRVPAGVIPLASRPARRRLADHGRRKPVRFAPEEHAALLRVARELNVSVSSLVTDALLLAYGTRALLSPG